jgi:hypothetical protein
MPAACQGWLPQQCHRWHPSLRAALRRAPKLAMLLLLLLLLLLLAQHPVMRCRCCWKAA